MYAPSLIPYPMQLGFTGGMLIGVTDTVKKIDPKMEKEAYEINVKDKIFIKAGGVEGLFYADLTVKQLLFQYDNCIPKMIIYDRPKYSYRSFMIDCCRHFFPVEDIKAMIDLCASFKFNKFHWHLTDDQGWRIQIDKYPELTQIGSVRHGTALGKEINDEDYGGFYTKNEIRDVVDYAAQRYIEVIPEFDVPGHTSALLASLPELCCGGDTVEVKKIPGIFRDIVCAGNEKTYEVIFDIIDEICELFPGEYFHIGGDEAPKHQWKNCEKCQEKIKSEDLKDEEELQGYFVNRVSDYLRSKGKKVISWNESLKGGNLNSENIIQFWMDKDGLSKKSPNNIIMSDFFSYYVDYPYEMTPLKKTYNHDEKLNSNVIGVDTPIWTEYVPNFDKMLYMCFPRFIAVAQSAWSINKPEYEIFEKDLLKLMKMYDTSKWGQRNEWNKNRVKRLFGTTKHFLSTVNRETVKKFVDERKGK